MHFNRHYCLPDDDPEAIAQQLAPFGVHVTIHLSSAIFDLPENHPNLSEIEQIIPVPTDVITPLPNKKNMTVIWTPVYTEKERMQADFLEVRCVAQKVCAANPAEVWTNTCYRDTQHYKDGTTFDRHYHSAFNGHVICRSSISWGQRYFAGYDMDPYMLFCREEARDILTRHGMLGIDYRPVIKHSTGLPMEGMYCMLSKTAFPADCFGVIANAHARQCPVCGKRIWQTDNMRVQYGIVKPPPDDLDFYVTEPCISGPAEDPANFWGRSTCIISQRMYRLLKEMHMTRALVFTPLPNIAANA